MFQAHVVGQGMSGDDVLYHFLELSHKKGLRRAYWGLGFYSVRWLVIIPPNTDHTEPYPMIGYPECIHPALINLTVGYEAFLTRARVRSPLEVCCSVHQKIPGVHKSDGIGSGRGFQKRRRHGDDEFR